jgi:EmrB/QacA subfamily drug resistance transporter
VAEAGPVHEPDSDLVVEAPGATPLGIVPWPLLWRERVRARLGGGDRDAWVVLAVTLLGLFAVGSTITVLAVSFPLLVRDLDSTQSTVTWVLTGPMLAMAVAVPTMGKLADIHGARRVYLLGMSAATVFAVLTALAWSAESLIAFRVLGAATGAAAGPASMALINSTFDRRRRVQAMGYWSLVAAGGPVIGVVILGPVVEAHGWRWIFAIQAPFTLAVAVIGFFVLPDTVRRRDVRFDIPGSILIALAAASALVALNRGHAGWTSPAVLVGFALAPILLVLWVRVERRVDQPLFPLEYLGERNFAAPVANQFFTNFAYMGGFIITPLLLQDVLDLSIAESGYVSIVRPLTFAIAGPVAGWAAIRVGERRAGVFGSTLLLLSMLVFATVGTDSSLVPVFVALALSGVAMGTASPAMAASVANAVQDHDLGIAGAAQQMVSTLGTAAGTQVLFTVQEAQQHNGLSASFHAAYLVGAVAAAVGVVASAFVVRSRHGDAPRGRPEAPPRDDLREALPA